MVLAIVAAVFGWKNKPLRWVWYLIAAAIAATIVHTFLVAHNGMDNWVTRMSFEDIVLMEIFNALFVIVLFHGLYWLGRYLRRKFRPQSETSRG